MANSGKKEGRGSRQGQGIKRYKLPALDKPQRYTVEHKGYSQYSMLTVNEL